MDANINLYDKSPDSIRINNLLDKNGHSIAPKNPQSKIQYTWQKTPAPNAQQNCIDLTTFVLSQPQLPFIRPAVRSFILYLRSAQPANFTKQLRQFLLADTIAMHIKRLTVESLADMTPTTQDLRLVTLLFTQLPDLFGRFLDKAQSHEWFQLLYNHWLNNINLQSANHNVNQISSTNKSF